MSCNDSGRIDKTESYKASSAGFSPSLSYSSLVSKPAPDFSLKAIELSRPTGSTKKEAESLDATVELSSSDGLTGSSDFEVTDGQGNGKEFQAKLSDYRGKWLVLFFYPRDFSFVCPTELSRFSARKEEFDLAGASILAVSVDDITTHRRFMESGPQEGGVGRLRFPLASDPNGEAASAYGVWDSEKQLPLRGLFLIDPDGIVQYSVAHCLSVGRSVDETLRVLSALQSGGLCPVDWTDAEGNIDLKSALKTGRVIGHYRIESVIGGGSFGTILSAWDLRLRRPVALKVLRHNNQKSREDSLAEARSVATLNHSNICAIYSVDIDDGLPMIVMPLIDGNPLSKIMAMNPMVQSPERICKVFRGIVSGVAAAHKKQIVHGDLKPANFMIDSDDHVTVLDFGLSKYVDDFEPVNSEEKFFHRRLSDRTERVSTAANQASVSGPASHGESDNEMDMDQTIDFEGSSIDANSFLVSQQKLPTRSSSLASGNRHQDASRNSTSRPGQESISSDQNGSPNWRLSGTPAYMAPEQIKGAPASKATDIFALGLIFFELAAGRRALNGNRLSDVFQQLGDQEYLESLSGQLSEPFKSLAGRMLDFSPENRPSAEQILECMKFWDR